MQDSKIDLWTVRDSPKMDFIVVERTNGIKQPMHRRRKRNLENVCTCSKRGNVPTVQLNKGILFVSAVNEVSNTSIAKMASVIVSTGSLQVDESDIITEWDTDALSEIDTAQNDTLTSFRMEYGEGGG